MRAGTHRLALYQPNGAATELPVRVLPPNPVISNAPVRANLGEERQRLLLRGSGLDRMERIDAPGAQVESGPRAATDSREKRSSSWGTRPSRAIASLLA